MDKKTYDFSGWATKNNIRCSDGRTIRKDAFKINDGETVPLVWNHDHKDADSVLGHALLENREEGVYAYCSFNNTRQGQNAKQLVMHRDVRSLSIYANQLKQQGSDVIHGIIREVSLVLAGANRGAYIDNVIAHSDSGEEEYNQIWHEYDTPNGEHDLNIIEHSCDSSEKEELEHSNEDSTNDQKKEDNKMADENKTVQDVFDSLSEEQKNVVYFLIQKAVDDAKGGDSKDNMEDGQMKHNAFDNETEIENSENTLTHSDLMAIVEDAQTSGSLKKSFNSYCLAHGITNIENLFPDAKLMPGHPLTLNNEDSWVAKVMGAVHHTPFAKVKSQYFDITADEARARGYVKGDEKVDEVIVALGRETTPQTVYKHQTLDRDDVIDITDFDVVAYLKAEMRGKLEEELARAFLIGDGRSVSDKYKIKTGNIRPILGDDAVYSEPLTLDAVSGESGEALAKRLIKAVKKNRKLYKGKGNPTFYTTEDVLADMLLIEDKNERVIYETPEQLAKALRVKEIVTVPPMEGATRTTADAKYSCLGILVNLDDYNVGADKGGQVSMFDDFDIDYNKLKYLIETRCSGALVAPKSALTFELKTSSAA